MLYQWINLLMKSDPKSLPQSPSVKSQDFNPWVCERHFRFKAIHQVCFIFSTLLRAWWFYLLMKKENSPTNLMRQTASLTIQPYPTPRQSSAIQIFICSVPTIWLECCARLWDCTLYKTEERNLCFCLVHAWKLAIVHASTRFPCYWQVRKRQHGSIELMFSLKCPAWLLHLLWCFHPYIQGIDARSQGLARTYQRQDFFYDL